MVQTRILGTTLIPIIVKHTKDVVPDQSYFSLLDSVSSTSLRHISRFRMTSLLARSDSIGSIADNSSVETVFFDKRNGIPELPSGELSLIDFAGQSPLGLIRNRLARNQGRIGNLQRGDFVTTNDTAKYLGADIALQQGYDGSDVTVAIVDTGMSPRFFTHPQIRRRFTYSVPKGIPEDTNGHSTWLITSIFGNPYTLSHMGLNLHMRGLAPKATPIVVKALYTPGGIGSDSLIIAAVDAAMRYKPDVINMSLGSKPPVPGSGTPQQDALVNAVEQLPDTTIACIASGNDGADSLGSPAIATNAISVGAMDIKNGQVAAFSNRGPDFVAPGVNILSGIQSGTLLDVTGHAIPGFAVLSGTSMATPHNASMVSLAKQRAKQLGINMTWMDVKAIGKAFGTPKSHDSGYGVLSWDMITQYLK